MGSIFDTGGFLGVEQVYKENVTGNYNASILNTSGGVPDFRWTLNNTTAEVGGHTTTVNGTFSYSSSLIPSIIENSAVFNGTDSYLVPANDSLINVNTGAGYSWTKRSISLWFSASSATPMRGIWEEGGNANWLSIYLDGEVLYANIGEGSATQGHATASISVNQIYHCLVTVDLSLASNNIKIYLNGSLAGQATSSVGTDLLAHSGANEIGRGAARNHRNEAIVYSVFDGKIQDFCYWNEQALTQEDAQNIYNAGINLGYSSGMFSLNSVHDSKVSDIVTDGLVLYLDAGNTGSYPGFGTTWYDLSGNNRSGTLVGGVGYSADSLGYLTFDGVDNTVNFEYDLRSTWSYECWAFHNVINGFSLLGQGTTTANSGLHIWFISDTSLRFGMYSNDTDALSLATSTNTWYHYCFTYNHSTFVKEIYRNGVQLTGTPVQAQSAYTGTGTARIGATYSSGGGYANGRISNTKLYNRVLSANEIQQNFNALRGRYGI